MAELGVSKELDFDSTAMFWRQVGNYLSLGYNDYLGQTPLEFTAQFESLLNKALASAEKHSSSPIPLLIVLPEGYIPLNDQLRLTNSRAFLDSSEMHNIEELGFEPQAPYLLLGVDDGQATKELSPAQAIEEFMQLSRHGLRLNELIGLSVHAPELWEKFRGLYATGTVHVDAKLTDSLVDLYRYGDGGLKVKRDPHNINDPEWITPSYKDIVFDR